MNLLRVYIYIYIFNRISVSKEFPSKSQRKSLTVDQNVLAFPKIDDAKLFKCAL